MKNELEPWEVGLAKQVKEQEFSFDPQAFADFESLLKAESLGQEPGQQAPAEAGEHMPGKGGITLPWPKIILLCGLIGLAGLLFWPTAEEQATTPATNPPEITLPATSTAPTNLPAPAAAPKTTQEVPEKKVVEPSMLNRTAPPMSSEDVAEPASGELSPPTEEAAVPFPRQQKTTATTSIARWPLEPVVQLDPKKINLPEVRRSTPETINKRDRKALFPDVINKH